MMRNLYLPFVLGTLLFTFLFLPCSMAAGMNRRDPGAYVPAKPAGADSTAPAASAPSGRNRRFRDTFPNKQAGVADAPSPSKLLGIAINDAPKAWGIDGVVVCQVFVDSPADQAGVLPGDIIIAIDGHAITAESDFFKAAASLVPGHQYQITVRRGSQTLALGGFMSDHPAAAGTSSPVKRRLSDINVLKYAVIDPQSRVITLLGKYDTNYQTGPIPYYDLLNDALKSPYPSFSLEPTAETRGSVDSAQAAIGADVQRMYAEPGYATAWANRLLNLVLNDPTLLQDRAHFIKKGAEAFQITDDEMQKVLGKSLNPTSVSTDEMIPILGKVLRGLGYTQVGDTLLSQGEGGLAAYEKMGVATEAQAILDRFHADTITHDRAKLELDVLMESAMLRGMRAPEAEVTSRTNAVLAGSMSPDAFSQYMEDRLQAIITDEVGVKMFNGLTLSHQMLCKLYNVPSPQMSLVFSDVPTDSLLGDVLFRADYALKTICTNPDIKDRIPGFLTEMGYMSDPANTQGNQIPSDVGAECGHRLIPGAVKMNVSPSGTLVAFDDAHVNITGWVIKSFGDHCTPQVAGDLKSATEGYSTYLTQHYDELARVYPELHRMREAEKLIALSRWAAANHYTIVVDKATGVRLAQSPTVAGFWQGVFSANPQHFTLTVIAQGGASFDKNEGEEWIQPVENREVTADVSKQLVMSAILAKDAAAAAVGGDLETARDLADKSARAMTGDIDLSQLPALGDVPMPGDPAKVAELSSEAISAIDANLRQVENAKITAQKAGELEATSPAEAARMQEEASAQLQRATANLQSLHDALDEARNNPALMGDAVITIHGLGSVSPPPGMVANSLPTTHGTTTTPATPATPQPAPKDDLTPEERSKLIAELASLQNQLQLTQEQFGKLNKSIQQDQQQFADWEKVADDGWDRCNGFLYNLLMDSSAGQLSDRYEAVHKLTSELPAQPQSLIDSLARTKNWFKALSATQSLKDITDIARRDSKTLPELFEEVRDDINIINSVTGLDKTVAGAAWKQGSAIVDMAYSYAQFSAAYDGINQMDKNSDDYRKAVVALTKRMKTIVDRIKEIKAEVGYGTNAH